MHKWEWSSTRSPLQENLSQKTSIAKISVKFRVKFGPSLSSLHRLSCLIHPMQKQPSHAFSGILDWSQKRGRMTWLDTENLAYHS
jgi:hypothetical protein